MARAGRNLLANGDEELQSLAAEANANELTDLAKQALQSQLKVRGLKVEFVDAAPVSEASDRDDPRGGVDPSELELIDMAFCVERRARSGYYDCPG